MAAVILCCSLLSATQRPKKQPLAKPLNLNTATVEELQKLPGIGPTTAKAIVRFRERSGPFRRVEDLLAIRGITKRKLEKLRPYVRIAPSLPAKKTVEDFFGVRPSRTQRRKEPARGRRYSTWWVERACLKGMGTWSAMVRP